VTGRFPLLSDACVRRQVVDGLIRAGWDVQRAIDVMSAPILLEIQRREQEMLEYLSRAPNERIQTPR
jgi:hypothetical protein